MEQQQQDKRAFFLPAPSVVVFAAVSPFVSKMVAAAEFGNLKSDIGLGKLNEWMGDHSFVTGVQKTQDDVITFSQLLSAPDAKKFPFANRWYRHVAVFDGAQRASWPKGELKPAAAKKAEEEEDFDLFGGDAEADKEAAKKLADSKKKDSGGKKKKEIIEKSSLVIEIKPGDSETDLDQVARLVREITMDGLSWNEAMKKVPIAFGLYKLQMACTIVDALVNTNELIDEIEALGMDKEKAAALKKKREEEEDEDEDEEEECGLVQSAEIISFSKL